MSGLEVIGLIVLIIIAAFLPRIIAAILACILLGGGAWWCLFIPLAIIGFAFDLADRS